MRVKTVDRLNLMEDDLKSQTNKEQKVEEEEEEAEEDISIWLIMYRK